MSAEAIDGLLATSGRRIGPFQLVHKLGAGGFAPVYLADETYGASVLRKVAVKVFSARDPAVREALVEEARALCRVEHPNVVRFHQIAEDSGGRLLALAMELVRGTSVADMLDAGGPLGATRATEIGIAVGSALAAVHRAGLVHRDVKPPNVIESGGVYKLIDFGIAARDAMEPAGAGAARASGPVSVSPGTARAQSGAHADEIARAATEAALSAPDATASLGTPASVNKSGYTLAGTMGYMDPACLAGAPATPASDLYALGCMLYECLSRRLPASTPDGRADKLRGAVVYGDEPPPPVASVAHEVPEALAALVDALVAPDPLARPKSAEWVVAELERIGDIERGKNADLPPEAEGPFRGLDRFEPRHRGVFLGRSGELSSALATLRAHGLLAVVGASGTGKSSLARASVLPAIEDGLLGGWPARWDAAIASPGADARASLEAAAQRLDASPSDPEDPDSLVQALLERVDRTGRGVVLFVDQLEELVTQGTSEGRRYAVRVLAKLAERPLPGLRAVVAVRRDFLDPLFGDEELGRAVGRGLLLVSPVTAHLWREILDEGLRRYKYAIDSDTRGEILGELRQMCDAMPLVQFALAQLWERRDPARRVIPRAALEAIGGVSGALDLHAERVTREIAARHGDAGLDAVRRVALALTSPQGTRLSLRDSDVAQRARTPLAHDALVALERARLVTREGDLLAFAHDAVLGAWKRLAQWLKEARADRELAGDVEAQAARWSRAKERELLWSKRRLSEARALVAREAAELSVDALAFVRASRTSELRRAAAGYTLVGALLVAGGLTLGLYRDSAAREARNDAALQGVEHNLLLRKSAAITEANRMIKTLEEKLDACEKARPADRAK